MKGDAIDSNRALALYEQGLTDKAIAARLGRPGGSIADWRRRHGLSPNKKKAHTKYIPPVIQDAIDAKELGYPSYGMYKAAQYEEERRRKKS